MTVLRSTRRPAVRRPTSVRAARRPPVRCGIGSSLPGSAIAAPRRGGRARVLLGDFTVTIPDFVRILGGADIPGASYIVMESKLPRAVLGGLVGCGIRGQRGDLPDERCGTRWRARTSSASASGPAPRRCSRSSGLGADRRAAVSVGRGCRRLGVALLVTAAWPARAAATGWCSSGSASPRRSPSLIQYLFTRADVYDAQLALRWLTGSVSAGRLAHDPAARVRSCSCCCPLVVWLARSLRSPELGRRHRRGAGRA